MPPIPPPDPPPPPPKPATSLNALLNDVPPIAAITAAIAIIIASCFNNWITTC